MRSNRSTNLLRIVAGMVEKPILNLEHFAKINNDHYSLIFSTPLAKKFSFDQYDESVAEITANKLGIEKGTLIRFSEESGKPSKFRCILSKNVESKAYTEENTKGWTATQANMFLDENDSVWKLEGDDDNKRLIRLTQEDFEALLEAKKTRSPIISSVDDLIPYAAGDYVSFFNHEANAIDYGTVIERNNSDYVLTREKQKLIKLRVPSQVLMAHQNDASHNVEIEKARRVIANSFDFDGYLDFIKQIYGADSPYYRALEKAMKEYAVD